MLIPCGVRHARRIVLKPITVLFSIVMLISGRG
jgi:hypothetical protein